MKLTSIVFFTLIFVLSFAIESAVHAQNFTVTGTVINAETGLAVEFANIGVEGTYLGTASDVNGNFEIILSQVLIEKQVSVSAVGYKTKTNSVGSLKGKQGLIIQLQPMNYGISEVNVEAQSKVGYGIIRAASNLIKDNYLTQPYSYKCYLQTLASDKESNVQDEAIFIISDKEGYGERSFAGAFQNINYRIQENNPHIQTRLLKEGLVTIDNLLSQDIVRNPGNILSVQAINEFDVQVLGREVLDNDSVWVISYNCKNPTVQNTGDPELMEYEGKIWIATNNYQVLKNSFTAIRNGVFRHGNSFYNAQKSTEKFTYSVETTYKSYKGKYVLSTINYIEKQAGNKNKSTYLKVIEVGPQDDNITQRQYFNNEAKDPDFWNVYQRPE